MEISDNELRSVAEELQVEETAREAAEPVENEAEELLQTTEMPQKEKDELKAQNFIRLAEPRVNKIISGLASLGKLSNHSAYSYSEEQVDKMFEAIQDALNDAKEKFKPQKGKSGGFSF